MTRRNGVGLDCGTMNFVAARLDEVGTSLEFSRIRNAFLKLDKSRKRMLRMAKKTDFIEREKDLVVIGDKAFDIANVFGKSNKDMEIHRPLSGGLLNSSESEALDILARMIKTLLGDPRVEEEVCYYSVPAVPLDDPEKDIVYHEKILGKIIEQCGYEAVPANEAMAIIFSNCENDNFSGISFSFGSGQSNVALAYNTMEAQVFSIGMGGDYIDSKAAAKVGKDTPASRLCAIKEKGFDLLKPEGKEQEALKIYYEHLIKTTLKLFAQKFDEIRDDFYFPEPIPIVVSGGTSKAGNFVPLFRKIFEEQYKEEFPIEISEIRHAKDPLNAVAHGLFIQAAQEDE